MAFSTKIKGNHHLQGNAQVYNVRIPDTIQPQKAKNALARQMLRRASAGFGRVVESPANLGLPHLLGSCGGC